MKTLQERNLYIRERLDDAYYKKWKSFRAAVRSMFKDPQEYSKKKRIRLQETIDSASKAAALLTEVLEMLTTDPHKLTVSDIFDPFTDYQLEKPKLRKGNPRSLNNLIRKIKAEHDGNILEYLRPKPKGWSVEPRKVTDLHKKIARTVYAHHSNKPYSEILRKVNEECERQDPPLQQISLSTLKSLFPREVRNILNVKRFGQKHYNSTGRTPLHNIKPLYALDRVELDSTKLSIHYYDPDTRRARTLTTCFVMDCHSNYILGCAFDTSENGKLIMEAFADGFMDQDRPLPAEVVLDQFPGHKGEDVQRFFNELRRSGTKIIQDKTGNPRTKGTMESIIGRLNDFARQYFDSIGGNITVKSTRSRVSKEAHKKIMARMQCREDVEKKTRDLIYLWNARCNEGKSVSRQEQFIGSAKPNAKQITPDDSVRLFWSRKIKKINQGLITMQSGYTRYYYEIDGSLKLKYNGTSVLVRYNDRHLGWKNDELYIYDIDSDEFLFKCTLQLQPHLASANRTAEDEEIISRHRSSSLAETKFIKHKIDEYTLADGEHNLMNFLLHDKEQIAQFRLRDIISGNPLPIRAAAAMRRRNQSEGEAEDDKQVEFYPNLDRLSGYDDPIPLDDDGTIVRLTGSSDET